MTEFLADGVVFSQVRQRTKLDSERLSRRPKTKATAVLGPDALSRVMNGPMSPRELETLAVEAGRAACPFPNDRCEVDSNFGMFPEELDELAVSCEGPCIFDDNGVARNVPTCALSAVAAQLKNKL